MTTKLINVREIIEQKRAEDPVFRIEFDRVHLEYQLIMQLVKERKAMDMSQDELAKKSGISQQALSRLEREKHVPTLSTFIKIINALGLEITLTKRKETDSI